MPLVPLLVRQVVVLLAVGVERLAVQVAADDILAVALESGCRPSWSRVDSRREAGGNDDSPK